MKAIILAGGRGTRLQPLTNTIPKALVSSGKETLIERVLDNLPDTIDTVIITTRFLGELIIDKIGNENNGKKIIYTTQSSDNGTWSALYSAKDHIMTNELFIVLNCDDIFNKTELTEIVSKNIIGMGVTTTTMLAQYHGIEIAKDGYVVALRRHNEIDKNIAIEDVFANGLYILNATIFSFTPKKTSEGEFGLPQTLFANIKNYPLFAHRITSWQPCNSFDDLKKITTSLSL